MKKLLLLALTTLAVQAQFLLDPYRFAVANTNVLNDGLVAYWKMDEVSGTRVDSGGSGLDMTDNNTVGSNTGIITNAAAFVAANSEFLSHVDDPLFSPGNTDFTFAFWIYPTFTGTAKNMFGKIAASNREYYVRHTGGDNGVEFAVSGNGTSDSTVSIGSQFAVANVWYFIVARHDAAANTISLSVNNGTVTSAAHTTGVFDGTADFSIGRNIASPYWEGRIDEFGFWNRVLTADEVTYLYNAGVGRTCCPFP